MHDPRVGRWFAVDPMVDKTMDSYGYCYQNPIKLLDSTGMIPEAGGDPDH